jgi:GNAT superfamily N-acetyltransferase
VSVHDVTASAGRTEPALAAFLTAYLGAWPPSDGLTVVGSTVREQPGWDGGIREIVGVGTSTRSVISVPPALESAVRTTVHSWEDVPKALPAAAGRPDARVFFGTFRWTMTPTDLPDAGEWIDATDPRVPEWLRPFGGEVLITLIDGQYAAGVGIKRHNTAGLELSVGTDERYRGQGLASRLVAQAARWVIAQGAVPIYLHDPANIASDRTALAAGFPDLGWQIFGLWGGDEQPS